MAKSKATKATDEANAKDGERRQMTDDGPQGIPVEEMSQPQREAVGKQLAEGSTFSEAIEEGSGPADETGEETDFDSMTKDELKTYADENGIEGVTSSMTKDEMLKAVKRGSK